MCQLSTFKNKSKNKSKLGFIEVAEVENRKLNCVNRPISIYSDAREWLLVLSNEGGAPGNSVGLSVLQLFIYALELSVFLNILVSDQSRIE